MRRFDWLLIIILIVGAVGGKFADFGAGVPKSENPRRPSPENFEPKAWDDETQAWMSQDPESRRNEIPGGAPLPDIGIIDGDNKRQSSTGSAFSISTKGFWLTARHVAEGCDTTFLQIGKRKGLKVTRTILHPNADVALLVTQNAPPGLPIRDFQGRRRDDAFNVGFPKGQPGAVHARYIGEMTMRHRGRMGFRERVNVWTEKSRIPSRFGSLGGLSGGAVLDDTGRIIGVVEAESRRRGRIMTAKTETLREILARADARNGNQAVASGPLGADDYPTTARRLITTLRVAKVICRVNRLS